MTRFLLTLLALLTGLAATGTPAAARMGLAGSAEIGVSASAVASSRVAEISWRSSLPVLAVTRLDLRQDAISGTNAVHAWPATLLRIDRAHE